MIRARNIAKERSKQMSKNVSSADVMREAITAGMPSLEKSR